MEFVVGTLFVLVVVGSIWREIDKIKGEAYLAKKYDEKKNK